MAHQKIAKHIEIVRSRTPGLSSMGQKSSNALFAFLALHFTTVGVTIINDESDLGALVARQPDLVFIGMKYVPSRSGGHIWISEYLETHGITHTGSAKEAIELEQNKTFAKERVKSAGVQTSPYLIVKNGVALAAHNIPLVFPLFVKPADLGAGRGVDNNSVVHTLAALNAKTKSVYETFGSDALIEQYLSGREFSVAVLKHHDSDKLMAMPLELNPAPNAYGDRILSEELKSAPLETPVLPVTDVGLRASLTDLATRAFIALGARDYGRIDIRLDANGTPNFLEANLIPCLIRGSGNFPKACLMNAGIDYDAMILHIVQLAFARTTRDYYYVARANGRRYSAAAASHASHLIGSNAML